MSNRKLTILGSAAVVMLIWAIVQSRIANRPASPVSEAPATLIQGLEPSKVASIVIGTGENAMRLNRKGNRFVVANKDDYPAKTSEINDLISNVLDIKTRELITRNRQNHADLEVVEDKASSVVKFLDENGDLITGVIIGKRAEIGDSYVRQASSDDVYLTADAPWIASTAISYIDKKILELDSKDDILSVTVTEPNESYTLKSGPDSTDVTLENMPTGKQLNKEHRDVFSALTNLRFEDVMKASSAPKDLQFDRNYICRLKNSTVYTLEIANSGDKTFIKCRADFTDTEEIVKVLNKVESEEELKRKEAKLLARDAAEKFNADHNNWVYEISSFKAKNLTKDLNSLLDDKEKPDETNSQPDSSNSAETE